MNRDLDISSSLRRSLGKVPPVPAGGASALATVQVRPHGVVPEFEEGVPAFLDVGLASGCQHGDEDHRLLPRHPLLTTRPIGAGPASERILGG